MSDDILRALVDADGWMLDVDGCLVRTASAGGAGGVVIPGAADLIGWLRRRGRKFIVCTNASQKSAKHYADHLRWLGLDIEDHEFMTAATAAAAHIARHHPGAMTLAIGDSGLEDALSQFGVEMIGPGGRLAEVVVVGAADTYSAAAINAACLAIADRGASFYVSVDTPWFYGGVGRSVSVSTAIAAAISSVTGQRPQVCGKPSPAIGEVLREHLGGEPGKIVIVGDMASIEMRLARQMGALGVLVMSGGTSPGELDNLPSHDCPHLHIADVGALFELLQRAAP